MNQAAMSTTLFVFVSLLLIGPNPVSGQQIFFDDFSDGNDDGWQHEEYFGYEGNWEITPSGQYRISSQEPIAVGALGSVGVTVPSVSNIGDGYLRVRITANTPGTSPGIFLQSLENPERSYLFNGSTTGNDFAAWECDNVTDCTSLPAIGEIISSFSEGQEWWMEAGKVGTTLSLKAWPFGSDEPTSPQQTYELDSPFAIDTFGLVAWISTGWQSPQRIDASYDDVSFRAVPEPSFPFAIIAAGLCVAIRRVRSKQRKITN